MSIHAMSGSEEHEILVVDRRKKYYYWANNVLYDINWLNGDETTFAAQIGSSAVSVYHYLCRCADNDTQTCDPGVPTIAKRTGLHEATVKKAKRILEDYRMVDVLQRTNRHGGRDTDAFHLLDPAFWDLSGGVASEAPPTEPGGGGKIIRLPPPGQKNLPGGRASKYSTPGVLGRPRVGEISSPLIKDEQALVQQASQQQPEASSSVVDSFACAEQKEPSRLEQIVTGLLNLRTGASEKAIRERVAKHPEHGAYVLAEWPSEWPHLPHDRYSPPQMLLERLRNEYWVSTRDQAQKRAQALREQRQAHSGPTVPQERPEERAARYESQRPASQAQEAERAAQAQEEADRLRAQDAEAAERYAALPAGLRAAFEAEARERMGPFGKHAVGLAMMARKVAAEFEAGTWQPKRLADVAVTPSPEPPDDEAGSEMPEPVSPELAARLRRAQIQNSTEAAGQFLAELSEGDLARVEERARDLAASFGAAEGSPVFASLRVRVLREMLAEGSLLLGSEGERIAEKVLVA